MDFVNNNIKRLGQRYPTGPHDLYQLPKKNPSELQQIHDQLISSIKIRMQNLPNEDSNQNFEKMVNQMRGQDVSAVSNLTKDFLKTTRKNLRAKASLMQRTSRHIIPTSRRILIRRGRDYAMFVVILITGL